MKQRINLALLKKRCLDPISAFDDEAERTVAENGQSYWFRAQPGANILFVAHLDTVLPPSRVGHFKYVEVAGRHIAYNAQFDDRLGVHIGLDVLPALGVKADVLLTEGEEDCSSSAQFFEPQREYNWIMQFDRSGTDVVMYAYETAQLRGLLRDAGFQVGRGTYTDICELEHLGVAGFNFGTGYYNNHSEMGYAVLNDTSASLKRFLKFYAAHHETKFVHEPQPTTLLGNTRNWAEWRKDDICPNCRLAAYGFDIRNHGMCWTCYRMTSTTSGATNRLSAKSQATEWDEEDSFELCESCRTFQPVSEIGEYGVCLTCWTEAQDQ